jgi:hypothetical protein
MKSVRLLALFLILAAVAGGVSAEEYPRRFGKSNAQILAMGSDKWMDFHGAKAGQSTAGMSEGMAAYRYALRWRNERLSAKASSTLRKQVAGLRPLLIDYTDHMMSIGAYMTGGGTIWSNIHASVLCVCEETLYDLLSGKAKPAKSHTTGMVKRQLDSLAEDITTNSKESYNTPEKTAGARKDLADGRATFAKIAAAAAMFDRKGSDHILAFCLSTAETAEGSDQ